MAQATERVALSALKVSPTTAQYHKPRSGPPIFYKERFKLPKETYEKTLGQGWLKKIDPLMPEYPYIKHIERFPEANNGLYGGATIQSGSKISDGRNKGKTLRKWFPNVKVENLRSQILKKTLTIPVTSRVKRTIKKCGGLDQYLLGTKTARIKELGMLGWKLRWHLKKAQVEAGDMPEKGAAKFTESFAEAWEKPEVRATLIQEQVQKWDRLREKDERFRRHMEIRVRADRGRSPRISAASRTLALLSPADFRLEELEDVEIPDAKKERKARLAMERKTEKRNGGRSAETEEVEGALIQTA